MSVQQSLMSPKVSSMQTEKVVPVISLEKVANKNNDLANRSGEPRLKQKGNGVSPPANAGDAEDEEGEEEPESESTEFGQVVQSEGHSESKSTSRKTPTVASLNTSSRVDKVSIIRHDHEGTLQRTPQKSNLKNKVANQALQRPHQVSGATPDALRYNSSIQPSRRVSLSQNPDLNKQGILNGMLTTTPRERMAKQKQLLFVQDADPSRDPPLTQT